MVEAESSSSIFTEHVCVVCRKDLDRSSGSQNWCTISAKGMHTILEFSILRGDDELTKYLSEHHPTVSVHNECRRNYTNKRRYEQEQRSACSHASTSLPASKSLRSSTVSFNWKEDCFFCSTPIILDERHPKRNDGSIVRTFEIREKMLVMCESRNDNWGWLVSGRLHTCNDLVAEEARYHRKCMQNFCNSRAPPESLGVDKSYDNEANVASVGGRREDDAKMRYFNQLCKWLETTTDQLYSVADLHEIMQNLAGPGIEVYSQKWLQQLLFDKYGDHLMLATIQGKNNVVCFKNLASLIINDKWYAERQTSLDDESRRIVTAAAKLICNQIRESKYDMANYPTASIMNSVESAESWIPDLLKIFMESLVNPKVKRVAISHAIVQATKPRSALSPVLFSVGISLDHAFGSRWVLDMMSKMGFSVSYDEVHRFKQCAVQCQDAEDLPASFPDCFTQWSGDNVDHNINTLDGSGSFHGMGMISMTTAYERDVNSGHFAELPVPRREAVKVADLIKNRGIPLFHYTAPQQSPFSKLVLKPLPNLRFWSDVQVVPKSLSLDMLWRASFLLAESGYPRPNWSGFMQEFTVPFDNFLPSADIRMLPLMDLNPNDTSCIYSTLRFVELQARRLNLETACITYDQPLWIKAVEIVLANNMNVVCRLGGFHILMSYLGSIGKIMENSGLAEAMQTCFGSVTVGHMLSGKAVARSIRGHILTQSALYTLLLRKVTSDDQVLYGDNVANAIDHLKEIFIAVVSKQFSLEEQESSEIKLIESCTHDVSVVLMDLKAQLESSSRTAKLWLQYIDLVQILLDFIRAERTSDWSGHLASLSKMLSVFAAAGHRHYAKSARLYLQIMSELPDTHPWLYEQLCTREMHAVRRTDRYWAGLWTDLVIEQVLMGSVKSPGGLTHGRGMSDSVRLIWIKSMHRCSSICATLSNFVNEEQVLPNVQHVEMGKARIKRDCDDMNKILSFFESRNPFARVDDRLRSLASGVVARDEDGIDCDNAETVGKRVMTLMDGLPFDTITLKKVDQAKTLAAVANTASATGMKTAIDTTTLFCRLLVLVQRSTDMEQYFKFELSAHPASIFKDAFSMRKCNKSTLSRELDKKLKEVTDVVDAKGMKCVVDGGWLLHKVKWQAGGVFGDVLQQYGEFVGRHFAYGEKTTVVFDGYCNGPSTKDHEHLRRAVKSAPDIFFDDRTPVYCNQEAFLANEINKKTFVQLLISQLGRLGFSTRQADGDADTMIVGTAMEIARSGQSVTVVANDTDILVLLLYHFHESMADVFMLAESSKKKFCCRSIRVLGSAIGSAAVKQLPVIHAISGCDTTSALYGYGKTTALKKISASPDAVRYTTTISRADASREDIVHAGLQLLILLYGGKRDESLNHLRYTTYMSTVASCSLAMRPERLPPTENAAVFHILRVHLQVVQWTTLMSVCKDPEEWGWKLINDNYMPVLTDLNAAPPDLLDIVKCGCKATSSRPCSTQLCSCVKNGLPCLAACKHCNGEVCENVQRHRVCDVPNSADDDLEDADESVTMDHVLSDLVPEDCLMFDVPWIDEELVETML